MLETIDYQRLQLMMNEYESVLDTRPVELKPFEEGTYIPRIYDVIGAFPYEVYPVDKALFTIIQLANEYNILFKYEGMYNFLPMQEVW